MSILHGKICSCLLSMVFLDHVNLKTKHIVKTLKAWLSKLYTKRKHKGVITRVTTCPAMAQNVGATTDNYVR